MAKREGFAEWLGSTLEDWGRSAGAEFGRALESVRHEVVDRGWFDRAAPDQTPSAFELWAGIEPAKPEETQGDKLGRTRDETSREQEPPSQEIER